MKLVDLPTREAYDRWAATYDVKRNPLIALDQAVLLPRLSQHEGLDGKRALDLGCGTGRNSIALNNAGADVMAVDFSKGMLDAGVIKAGAANIRFMTHDLNDALPFLDAAFDIVVCTLVLEHIERLGPLFLQMRRVCAPNGWIYISDIHPVMRSRGGRAQFSDHKHGEEVRPHGYAHQISDYVKAIVKSGLIIKEMDEYFGDAALAERFPKIEDHVGWPMLLTFVLSP